MKIRSRLLVLVLIVLILALPAGIFFSRSPVLILSDASFDALYGTRRALIAQVRLSLSLFRPAKKVMIAESAGPDAAAFALDEARVFPWGTRRQPWGAILPARYERGGQRYAEDHPQTPVVITEGRENRRSSGTPPRNLSYIATDAQTDAYRAGRCAVILARRGSGDILIYQDEQNSQSIRESFLQGLREEGFMGNPVFVTLNSDYSSFENISCVVLTGQAPKFFDRNLTIPVILFSWLNPALTPANVKLVFDDSPWALALRVFRTIPGEGGNGDAAEVLWGRNPLPSEIIIQERSFEDPYALKRIKTVIREEIPQ